MAPADEPAAEPAAAPPSTEVSRTMMSRTPTFVPDQPVGLSRDVAPRVDVSETAIDVADGKGHCRGRVTKAAITSKCNCHMQLSECAKKEWRRLEGICCSKSARNEFEQTWEEQSYAMRRARTVTVSEAERMALNGETPEMMEHVKKKWKNLCYDTSADMDWERDESLKCADDYVWYCSLFWLAIKVLAFGLPLFMINFVALLPGYFYVRCLTPPVDKLERTVGFWITFWVAFCIHLPSLFLALLALLLDYVMYYFFGIIWTACTCRWAAMCRSHKALDPYRNGPWLILHCSDIFACFCGQSLRHGFCGTAYNVASMVR